LQRCPGGIHFPLWPRIRRISNHIDLIYLYLTFPFAENDDFPQKRKLFFFSGAKNRFLTHSLKFLQDFIHFFVIFWLTSSSFRIIICVRLK